MHRSMVVKKICSSLFALGLAVCCSFSSYAEKFFWEKPYAVSKDEAYFPRTVKNSKKSYSFWQEVDKEREEIWISGFYEDDDGSWKTNHRFAGPFDYSGSEIPDLFSCTVTSSGVIAVAVQASEERISIYTSRNNGRSYECAEINVNRGEFFAPRIYSTRSNRFVLFVSRAVVTNPALRLHDFYIYQTTSDDGLKWSQFSESFASGTMANSFAPFMETMEGSEYVVFQSRFQKEGITTYQLYFSHSVNNGKSWSEPVLLSDENSVEKGLNFYEYNNEAPYLLNASGKLHAVWERKTAGSENSEIWYMQINKNGAVPGTSEAVAGKGNSRKAELYLYNNNLFISWFDNRTGRDQAYYSVYEKNSWNPSVITSGSASSSFPNAVINSGRLYYLWQEISGSQEKHRILFMEPDTTVAQAQVSAENYRPGTNSKNKKVNFKIKLPSDTSGISGYVYSWSRDEKAVPEKKESELKNSSVLRLSAQDEGLWHLKVSVLDNAGNWSEYSDSTYYLDLTPPGKISFSKDFEGNENFLSSNTFKVSWTPSSSDKDIEGYTYSLRRIGSIPKEYCFTPNHPSKHSEKEISSFAKSLLEANKKNLEKNYKVSETIQTKMPYVSWNNLSNGIYILSVSAVDQVGYVGEPVNIPVLLNKYVPKTSIDAIRTNESAFGDISIEIAGKDFLVDGTVTAVYIDRDGKAPYDLTVTKKTGGYKVSDTKISGIEIGRDLDEGNYFVGILHSDRGLCFTNRRALTIASSGTVKIENDYEYTPAWKAVSKTYRHSVYIGYTVLWLVLCLSVSGLFIFGVSVLKNYSELVSIKRIIGQLGQGALMQTEEKKNEAIKRNGSLKRSLAGFTVSLVVMIIVIISLSLGVLIIKEQERTLSKGLHDRVNVLLSSLTTGARTYLPTENNMELSDLLNQMSSLSEADYLSITGNQSSEASVKDKDNNLLYVWASNDKEITSKVDVLTSRKTINPGISKINESQTVENQINELCKLLNDQAREKCLELSKQIVSLNAERTQASKLRKDEIDLKTRENNILITQYLSVFSENGAGAIPAYNDVKLNRTVTEYLFYRPVLYRQAGSEDFVHGLVLLKVNTNSLIADVDKATRSILLIVLIISVVTIVAGAVVALGFASKIVNPIIMLEKTVTEISEENDKERLLAGDITDLPNNEIGRLGDSVNRMKKDLGYNERELNLQANEATPIQQSMVSLEPLSGNFKQNISNISDTKISEFAYYKGAAGASGDYFDFKKLDDRFYVLIKCDASGHAAPAGILVTMVATLYKKYFEKWSFAKNGTKLDEFVYLVNDFLESLNIKGKFVAMIVCLYDSKTGDVYMCHAGDRLVRIYDSQKRFLNKMELFETPAAGPFPSFMLQMKGGFKVEKTNLKQNDTLLLYTDGIEENGRIMRTKDFAAVMKPKVDSSGVQIMDEYGNLQFEPEKEEFGEERVKEIAEAVYGRKKYILKKTNNPSQGEVLEFDFSSCAGTTEEVILALSSCEKLFRLYRPVTATIKDLVEVDRSIDKFLKEHFSLYSIYAVPPTEESFNGRPVRNPKNPNNVFYAYMKEDVQEDDLTIVALKRN